MSAPIPAWKKLGLKLKYAQDVKPTENGDDRSANEPHGSEPERPAKRQRLDQAVSPSTMKATNGKKALSKSQVKAHLSDEQATDSAVPHLKRKKSVTFASDTKDEDGDSRTTIDFPVGSPGSTPKKQTRTPASSNTDTSPTTNEANSAKTKVKKKSKGERKAAQSAMKDKSEPSLVYLSQHRTDRASWKFNKNRDVWILSNALKTDVIPSDHLLALSGYVRGLPANAGARARLVKECQAALESPEITHDENAKQEYLDVVDRSNELTIPEKSSYASIPRSQLLLWALDENVAKPAQNVPLSIRKARKSRTAAPVDLSSSESESDSDSDSSSNSSTKDETSSSGSSTSSESNDSDNDSSSDSSSSDSA